MFLRPAACLALALAMSSMVCGQSPASDPPAFSGLQRFEVGGQTAQIRTFCVGTPYYGCGVPSFALGASGTLTLKGFLAIDAGYLETPSAGNGETNVYGGRASELLAGVRVEARGRHYGYFLEAQPGYLQWHNVITGVRYPTPTTFVFDYGNATHFISDVGPGVEYSPTARVHIRGELTDLIYHFGGGTWSNYFQPSLGVSYGLGPSVPWTPPPQYDSTRHRFFTPLNNTLLLASALAIAADAVTTQRFLAHGGLEGDPIARPLVKYGWSGQIAGSGLELGAETLAMYGLHRINHRWLARLLPVGVAAAHAKFAYDNDQDAGAGR